MPPTRFRKGRVDNARPTQDPRADSHKGAYPSLPYRLPAAQQVQGGCFRGGETLLRRTTSIAHHAFMSTTGEIGGTPGATAREGFTAPTGVAP